MRLLIDMNLSPRWCAFLSSAGFGTVHWSTFGRADAPDTEIMTFAAEGRKPSVAQIRSDSLSPNDIGQQVVLALHLAEPDLTNGALLTIEPGRSRLRILPLVA